MPAVIAATGAAAQMVGCREHHQPVGAEVEIAGDNREPLRAGLLTMKRRHAGAADAGGIAGFGWHASEQFIRNSRRLAPARTLVSRRGA